jgi:Heparinase II/III-like protein/Heparinase II/III N-terminus
MVFYENASWLKNRFQSMGPAEAISRLADVGRHVVLRASLKSLESRPDRRFEQTNRSHRAPEMIRKQLDNVSTGARDAVIAAASRWLEYRASFFSLTDIPLGNPIDWHRDYSSGVTAPVKYTGFINHRDRSKVGDIKYIWELNRLQHLILLALAGTWTGNANYWEEIEKQVISWDKSNPFMMGLNWKSPLEAGIRLITWAYVLFIMGNAGQERERFHKVLQRTIYQHQYFITKFYSKHSSANNHLVGEMAGLYVGSVFWPHYQESAAWRALARRKLVAEIARQVEADGVGKERATEYQVFILEFFLLAGALGNLIGDPFPQEYWTRVKRMLGFLAAISNRAGNLPMFGDGDNGQAVWLPETTPERVRHLVGLSPFHETSAINSDLRPMLLLWGQSPQEIPLCPLPLPRQNLEAFPDGGYYVLAANRGGENEMMVVFDTGPLGLPPLNAHGHADALSFWFSYGGEEFLIDPGTFTYYSSAQWRSYFRGTAAHNTIRIDGQDQSVSGGNFLWRETADCRVQHVEGMDGFVEAVGSHDGYWRLPDPVIHTRKLQLVEKSRTLVITDRLGCERAHDIELFFHFSEKCQVRQVGPGSFESLNRSKRISIRVDSRFKPQLYRGCEEPILGWVSRTFGVKEASFTLVARAPIMGSSQFLTEISAI